MKHALQSTGLTKPQAEGITEKLIEVVQYSSHDLVTKDFLKSEVASLETKMAGLETRLQTKMAGLETRLETKMAGLETRLETKMAGLETKMTRLEAGLETKMAGLEVRLTKLLVTLHFAGLLATLSLLSGWIYFLLKK